MRVGQNFRIAILSQKIKKCMTNTATGASKSPICQGRIAFKDTP